MKKKPFLLSLLLCGTLLTACNDDPEQEVIETEPVEFTKEGELYLVKTDGDTIQKLDIEFAETTFERETGLMYRKSMATNQGMLFLYDQEAPRAFYMKNTYIPLDIIYFGSDSTAVSFQENAKPLDETPLPSEAPAQFILEINAGLVQEWNIETGDKIDFEKD
ncbi:hypothetical protein GCM10007103_23540 [Salinimicrobium marinum]|uniref:DUF192 domain-containing protein n=1 Tax=Salinimicrobium marinum TaxID=680283 RepID=A0A918VZT8_9FLAO|nr:DUF192 domain-containing protein [Salinimicrobium marinum]GHA41405.1 hypothetical protein GCM10007103_23540 [Salinimicrobium marinum]